MIDPAAKRRVYEAAGEKPPDEPKPENEWIYGPSLSTFLGDDEPDEDDSSEWHIRGLIARDVAGFLAGDPKTGKTMIAESWGVALAMGAPDWCGFPIYGAKRVLIMPREDSERTTRIRLWQLARGAGLQRPHDLESRLAIDPTSPLNLGNTDHVKRLREACERFDIVIVDSFTTAHLGDENSVKDIARAMEPARDIAAATKTSVVFVHHFNGKGNADDKRGVKHRLRGSSALSGYARHMVGITRGPKRGQVELASDGNLAHQTEPTVVELVSGTLSTGKRTLGYKLVGNAIAALQNEVVRTVTDDDRGWTANEIAEHLGGTRTTLLQAVRKECEPGGRLEKRNKRIYLRNGGSRTDGDERGTSSGSGSPPFRGNQPRTEPGAQRTEWWDA